MFAAIISRALFCYAFYAGATDAQDVAQDVLVRMLRRPPFVRKNLRGYLRSVVYNEVCSQWRRTKRKTWPLTEEMDTLKVPRRENDDAWEAVDRLMAEEPDLMWWLVDYSERASTGSTDRVNALRHRRKLREVLAT